MTPRPVADPRAAAFGQTRRQRAVSAVLALAINAVILWMLLHLVTASPPPPPARAPTTLTLLPEGEAEAEQAAEKDEADDAPAKPKAQAERTPPAETPPPPPVTPPLPDQALPPLPMISLSRADMASADIGRMQRAPAAAPGNASASNGEGEGEGASSGGARGPQGQRLYAAVWYREPTQAELNTFLPGGRSPGSWGQVICRTVADFRVEDCQEYGESPPGSGLARGVRQASWQFRIRPPRINGRSMIGEWVVVTINITKPADER